jgi:hypothetical protein
MGPLWKDPATLGFLFRWLEGFGRLLERFPSGVFQPSAIKTQILFGNDKQTQWRDAQSQ